MSDDHQSTGAVIAPQGFHPGVGYMFTYDDGKLRFWFYARMDIDEAASTYALTITNASRERLRGAIAPVDSRTATGLEEAIATYLTYFTPTGTKISSGRTPAVAFTWSIRQ